MTLQTIINLADNIEIDRRKVVGVQFSRNEIPRVSQTPTRNPWKFTVAVSAMLEYSECRQLIEGIDYLDRIYPETISFSTSTGATSGLNFMLSYQGELTANERSDITVISFSGNQLTLGNLPSVSPTTVMFAQNDFIQLGTTNISNTGPGTNNWFPFPFTSVYPILRGEGDTVTVTTHRPAFGSLSTATTGLHIVVGNQVQFYMFVKDMPTYKFNAGGSTALITFKDPFGFYEWTGDV